MLKRRKRTLICACMVAVAIAVGGCGSSGVSASSYVSAVCSAVGPFAKDVSARAGSLTSALSGSASKSPAEGKALLKGFLSAIAADSSRALARLKAAGTPNVPHGKEIADRLVSVFARLDGAIRSADRQAAALPISSAAAFKTAAVSLGATIQSSVTGIDSGLGSLKSPQLEKAAAKSAACRSIGAS
jgi:hypothetical protein